MNTRRRRTNSGREHSEENNGYTNNAYSTNSYSATPSSTQSDNYHSEVPVQSSFITTDSNMTCRDRTNEFLSAVKSMQTRRTVSNGLPRLENNTQVLQVCCRFHGGLTCCDL